MNGFLLDTNIISELTKPVPEQGVITFLSENRNLWISSVTVHELKFGIDLLPAGKRRAAIERTVDDLANEFSDRIIALDREEAKEAAILRARAQKSGQTASLGDALIAGTALKHRLAVVTRNVSDFRGLGVDLVNPWGR